MSATYPTPGSWTQELQGRLTATGAVAIEGPKACGKTATARQIAASEVLLAHRCQTLRETAALDPALRTRRRHAAPDRRVAAGGPAIWNHVRRAVDDRQKAGQFILAGSAVPADDITRHTGAGRITRLRMRPMTSFEMSTSSGEISLARLLVGEPARSSDSGLAVTDLAREIAVGGWPGFRGLSVAQALHAVRDYLEEIRRVDVSRVEDRRRDPAKVGQLLRSLARNVSTYAANYNPCALTAEVPRGPLKDDTVRVYLDGLKRLMIVEDQPAWAPHLRSSYALRSAAKRHLVDPSLAVAALRATPERILDDIKLFGFLFESLVIRDTARHAQAADARVLQYRDSHGLEVGRDR